VTTVAAGSTVHDFVTVTGQPGQPAPSGDVTIEWFTNGSCATPAAATATVGLLTASGQLDGTSFSQGPLAAGFFAFEAHYLGDATYVASDGACEPLQVAGIPQTITFTSTPPSPALVGGSYTPSATGGGSGNPVVFSIDPSSGAGGCLLLGDTVSFTGPGTCVLDANQAGNSSYLAADQKQQAFTIVFGKTVTTNVTGTLTVASGQSVYVAPGTTIGGHVTVHPGGLLWVQGAKINGSLSATGAGALRLCGSTVNGSTTITGTTGPIVIGDDDGPTACAGNKFGGSVSVTGNSGGVEFDGNTVGGSLTITGDTGTLAPPDTGSVDVAGNKVSGSVKISP
jgi:hypothetical protein